jgi:hypothetical protein
LVLYFTYHSRTKNIQSTVKVNENGMESVFIVMLYYWSLYFSVILNIFTFKSNTLHLLKTEMVNTKKSVTGQYFDR